MTDEPDVEERHSLCDVAAEQVVLGLCLTATRYVEEATDLHLTGADFYLPKHGVIWAALLAQWAASEPTDPTTLIRTLQQSGDLDRAGGGLYLVEMLEKVPTSVGTLAYHARIVKDWAKRRRVREAGQRVARAASNLSVDVDTVIDQAQATIQESTVGRPTQMLAVRDFIDGEFAHLEDIQAGLVEPGIPSGFTDLDRLLGGAHPGRLIIPAGRPGMGKSIFAVNWARKAALLGHPVLIFPMEMSKREVMWRLWSDWARIPLHLFPQARFSSDEWTRLKGAREEIRSLPLVVDDQVNSVPQIVANSRRFVRRYGRPGLIIPDHIGRLQLPGKERHDIEVGNVAKSFKELSRELETTVLAPCQINRGNESRSDKVPQLSDLRDSGGLEQEADQVILIYRPDYYDKESPRAGEADFVVAKNRHGPTDTVTVAAQLHLARFVDMAIT